MSKKEFSAKQLKRWGITSDNFSRMVVGIAKHPDGLWQTWVLTPDNEIVCCSAHLHAAEAEKVANALCDIWESHDYTKLKMLPKVLRSEYKPKPLPQDTVLNLKKSAIKAVQAKLLEAKMEG